MQVTMYACSRLACVWGQYHVCCCVLSLLQEDALIMQMVKELGMGKWSVIASHLPGRIGKQCRER